MTVVGRLHGGYVHPRRVQVLARHFAELLPERACVLDIGAGDGLLAAAVSKLRPDLELAGVDVVARPSTHIPVARYDGRTLPYGDGSFDAGILADVLHHADSPFDLLAEAARVVRAALVVKDHLADGVLARPTLRFMDSVGNARHGVPLPHNYWRRKEWRDAFTRLGLDVTEWRPRLGLYPAPASFVFERSLHFVALLRTTGDRPDGETEGES